MTFFPYTDVKSRLLVFLCGGGGGGVSCESKGWAKPFPNIVFCLPATFPDSNFTGTNAIFQLILIF
jgi:hypothetical protein